MHPAQDEQHGPDFDRQSLDSLLRGGNDVAKLKRHAHIAEIDQVEADYQQMIDRVGQWFVPVKDVNQKDAPVFVQGVGDPDGQGNTDSQISQVSCDFDVHSSLLF